jgi:hypothetical protein
VLNFPNIKIFILFQIFVFTELFLILVIFLLFYLNINVNSLEVVNVPKGSNDNAIKHLAKKVMI